MYVFCFKYRHWIVLLKYNYKTQYIVLEIILEFVFEWAAFSSLEKCYDISWIGGVIILSMVFAHWCYFGAGILNVLFMREVDEVTNTMSHQIRKCSMLNALQETNDEVMRDKDKVSNKMSQQIRKWVNVLPRVSTYEETKDEEIAKLNY